MSTITKYYYICIVIKAKNEINYICICIRKSNVKYICTC